MQCPACGRFDVDSLACATYIPGGQPPVNHKCRFCGWHREDPAIHLTDQPKGFQGRLIVERDTLDERLGKLKAFLDSEEFLTKVTSQQQVLLWTQAGLMQGYLNVLNKRLELLSCDPTN